MGEKLKPCPFCDGQPTIEPWHGGGPGKHAVHCEHCVASPMVTGETRDEALKAWNTRPGEATLRAHAEAMAERTIELNAELDAYWNDESQSGKRPPESYIQRITMAQIASNNDLTAFRTDFPKEIG